MLTKFILISTVFAISISAYGQTYSKIVSEGTAPGNSSLVTIPAAETYRWGDPVHSKWCDSVTVTVSTKLLAYNSTAIPTSPAATCLVNGKPPAGGDVSPGYSKELDGLEVATAWIASVVTPPAVDPVPVTIPASGVTPPPVGNSVTTAGNFTVTLSGVPVNVSWTCTSTPIVGAAQTK